MQQSSLIYLNNLISQKQNSSNDEELNKKLQMLKIKINNGILFKIDFNTAMKLLKVIGVPDDELIDVYKNLMSSQNYKFFDQEKTINLVDVEDYKRNLK